MKKILSIILAAAMLLALCPAVFAADAMEATDGYNYVFTKEALNSASNVQMAALAEMKLDDVITEKSDPWRAAANLYLYNAYLSTNGFYWNAYNDRATTGEGCFGIELSVPEGGTFVPSLTYTTLPSGPIVDVYLVKEDVISSNVKTADFTFAANGNGNSVIYYFTRSLGDEHKLAQLDMYSDTQKSKTVTFAERTLDSNSKYYLLFRTVGTNEKYAGLSDKYLEVMLKSFSLTPVAEKHAYNFTKEALNSASNVQMDKLATMKLDDVLAEKSDPWRASANLNLYNAYVNENGFYWNAYNVRATTGEGCFGIELSVSENGMFVPSLTYTTQPSGPIVDAYLVKEDVISGNAKPESFTFEEDGSGSATIYAFITRLGEAHKLAQLDMYSDTQKTKTVTFAERTLDSNSKYYLLFRTVGTNEKYAGLSDKYLEVMLKSFDLTPVKEFVNEEFVPGEDESEEVTATVATVTTLAYYGETSETIKTQEVTYGENVNISEVPATVTNKNGTYNFLYWAKGLATGKNKHVFSTSNEGFSYKPHEGNNVFIAVYEDENAETEAFYNYNGQLLTDVKITEGETMPALPSMAGLGNAIAWIQLGSEDTELKEGDPVPTSGDKIFMAKYEDLTDKITINGTSYAYGDKVICKNIVTYDADNFSYWARTVNDVREIVSVDPDYSFHAFTDCTIEAVCVGKINVDTPRKILLSTFKVGDMTAVMAEFIGFGDAKEKGIMFDGQKIAMTTDYAQFTVTNDTVADVTVTGYAVVDTERINNGSITVSGVTAE